MLYTHIQMQDPQTGRGKDEWACAVALTPILLIENARTVRGVQAATESFRNEALDRQDRLNNLIAQASRRSAQIKDIENGALDGPKDTDGS
jgi:hypothetical protein